MANKNLSGALKNYPLAHLPTLALIIGTLCFWLELYVIKRPQGHTSGLAWILLGVCASQAVFVHRRIKLPGIYKDFCGNSRLLKGIFLLTVFLALAYLLIGFYASLLPPHLMQESDALMYHITVPRQHLLRHSFAHLYWSVPDLFLLPLDYALSPFELSTGWPNKFIQFIFWGGSLACVFHLAYLLSGRSLRRAYVACLAVMACHIMVIQEGLAMLDVVMFYCFLAFLHSLLTERFELAAIEFTFVFWSKAFIPPQMLVIAAVVVILALWALKKGHFQLSEYTIPKKTDRKKWWRVFLLASLVVALPYLIKSLYYTGTPLYPFGAGYFKPWVVQSPQHWQATLQRAADCLSQKDDYGHGRSPEALLQHFWLIAVPEKGVNNAFDYPVGLVYLLMLGPFAGHVIGSLRHRKFPLLSMIVVIWWMTWWFGSQQSRFLLIPVGLMIILSISYLPKISRGLVFLIIFAVLIELVSLIDSHRHDWGKPAYQLLRDKDRRLLQTKPPTGGREVDVDFPDAAFAPFPVNVHNNSYFAIPR